MIMIPTPTINNGIQGQRSLKEVLAALADPK